MGWKALVSLKRQPLLSSRKPLPCGNVGRKVLEFDRYQVWTFKRWSQSYLKTSCQNERFCRQDLALDSGKGSQTLPARQHVEAAGAARGTTSSRVPFCPQGKLPLITRHQPGPLLPFSLPQDFDGPTGTRGQADPPQEDCWRLGRLASNRWNNGKAVNED